MNGRSTGKIYHRLYIMYIEKCYEWWSRARMMVKILGRTNWNPWWRSQMMTNYLNKSRSMRRKNFYKNDWDGRWNLGYIVNVNIAVKKWMHINSDALTQKSNYWMNLNQPKRKKNDWSLETRQTEILVSKTVNKITWSQV